MKRKMTYWDNGNKFKEEWQVDGELHRIDGPAKTRWYENGNKIFEVWCVNGELHRIDGPAYVRWYENGNKFFEVWYINGVEVTSIINRLGFTDPLTKEQVIQLKMIMD